MTRNQRETYLTIGGLVAIVVAFYVLIQRPGQKTSAALQTEIAQAQCELNEIPLRLAELKAVKADLAACTQYLDDAKPLMLSGGSIHTVIRAVADLAGRHRLNVSRIEPLSPEVHETYQKVPFHIQFQGPFQGVLQLISELEQSEHLFVIENFTIARDIRQNVAHVDGEMQFSVYAAHPEFSGSTEISSSTGLSLVDSNR